MAALAYTLDDWKFLGDHPGAGKLIAQVLRDAGYRSIAETGGFERVEGLPDDYLARGIVERMLWQLEAGEDVDTDTEVHARFLDWCWVRNAELPECLCNSLSA